MEDPKGLSRSTQSENENPAQPPATQEQLLSGMLTVLVSRMGGRVVLSMAENKRVFERLMKQNKVITMRFDKTEIILELMQAAPKPVATGQSGDKIEA